MTQMSNRKKVASELAGKIEESLNSFGIKSKIVAVNFEKKSILLELSVAQGVRVEDVESLSRTLAMVVASPTGEVAILAPLPGTSHIGIRVPLASKKV